MRVLVACEFSGTIRSAFRRLGHDAWSCDIRPAEDGSPFHFQTDCRNLLFDYWDLLIAHPPCTHLSISGVCWTVDHWRKQKNKPPVWHDGAPKRAQQKEAVEFFRELLDSRIRRKCLENPMSMASTLVAPKSQTIHPWQFGHLEQKTTWLWLRNLPLLKPTNVVFDAMMQLPKNKRERVFYMPPSQERERGYAQLLIKELRMQWHGNGAG